MNEYSELKSLHAISSDQQDYLALLNNLAEWGDPVSQHDLGALYLEGRDVPLDYAQAIKWHLLAAEQGYAASQHDLGVIYAEGLGVSQDSAHAAEWFAKSAAQGDGNAQNNLAILYATGDGVSLDLLKAYMWFTLAIQNGVMDALENREIASEQMSHAQIKQALEMVEKWQKE
ncbi:MAG: sel1 repeat family protein [Magnetococcus sp. DMHC-6]